MRLTNLLVLCFSSQRASNYKNIIWRAKTKIKNWFKSLSREQALYFFGSLIFILLVFSNSFFEEYKNEYRLLLLIPAMLFVLGLGSYLFTQTILITNPITKYIIAPASLALGTNLALALSSQIINVSLGTTSSPFILTKTTLAILLSPLVLGIFFSLSGIFLAFLLPINFSKKNKFQTTQHPITLMTRIVTFISIWMIVIGSTGKFIGSYSNLLGDVSKFLVFHLESEEFSHCKKKKSQRVAFIDSNNIILIELNDKNYSFTTGECKIKGSDSIDFKKLHPS